MNPQYGESKIFLLQRVPGRPTHIVIDAEVKPETVGRVRDVISAVFRQPERIKIFSLKYEGVAA